MRMKLFHSNLPFTFGGLENDFEGAKVCVLPVPYDGTASYKTGQRHGPRALIEASLNMELWDIELAQDASSKVPIYTFDGIQCGKKGPDAVVKAVEESVGEILDAKKFPLMIGGEHSITSGAVKACAEKFKNLSVLHIDAHADMREEYEGTKFSHACAMARCREICPAVSVGIRSMSEEEAKTIKQRKLGGFIFGSEFDIRKVVSLLSENVYITIDIDGFDPSIMPATGTPEPGGLQWQQVLDLMKAVGKEKRVVGADIVELMPLPPDVRTDFACAKLAYKLVGYCVK